MAHIVNPDKKFLRQTLSTRGLTRSISFINSDVSHFIILQRLSGSPSNNVCFLGWTSLIERSHACHRIYNPTTTTRWKYRDWEPLTFPYRNLGRPSPEEFQNTTIGSVWWKKWSLRSCHCFKHIDGDYRHDKLVEMQTPLRNLEENDLAMVPESPNIRCKSYQDLSRKLIHQFTALKHHKLSTTNLLIMRQGHSEPLSEYLACFNKATIKGVNLNQEIFVWYLHNGVKVWHFNESVAQNHIDSIKELMEKANVSSRVKRVTWWRETYILRKEAV